MKILIKTFSIFLIYISTILGSGGPPPPLPFVSSNISGVPHQAPLFLKDTNNVTIFTQLSFFTTSKVDAFTNVEGTRLYNSNQEDKNLYWDLSTVAFNAGCDVKLWEWSALFGMLQLESQKSRIELSGYDFGIGLVTSAEDNIRVRLDLGLAYHQMEMKTIFASNFSDTSSVSEVKDNSPGLNPFISMTVNTAFKDWVINPFFRVCYSNETLFDVFDSYRDIYSSIEIYTVTPGITYRLSKSVMMVVGGNYFIPSELNNRSSKAIFSGFAQFNFLLE